MQLHIVYNQIDQQIQWLRLIRAIPVPVPTVASVFQWGHLTIPVSVQLATLDRAVRLTLMTVCQQSAPTTACVLMELTHTSVFVIPILN